jgi:hypothetical protein
MHEHVKYSKRTLKFRSIYRDPSWEKMHNNRDGMGSLDDGRMEHYVARSWAGPVSAAS